VKAHGTNESSIVPNTMYLFFLSVHFSLRCSGFTLYTHTHTHTNTHLHTCTRSRIRKTLMAKMFFFLHVFITPPPPLVSFLLLIHTHKAIVSLLCRVFMVTERGRRSLEVWTWFENTVESQTSDEKQSLVKRLHRDGSSRI